MLVLSIILYLCIFYLTHGSVIFDILETPAFDKFSTCWVFQAIYICVFVYLHMHFFDTRE